MRSIGSTNAGTRLLANMRSFDSAQVLQDVPSHMHKIGRICSLAQAQGVASGYAGVQMYHAQCNHL